MRIIHKLSLGMLAVALLIPLVSYWALRQSSRALEESIAQISADLAVEVVSILDRHFHGRIEELQAYSKSRTVQETLARSNAEFLALEDPGAVVERIDARWREAGADETTPEMVTLIGDPLSAELRDIMEMHERKYGYRVFGEIFLTNAHGANVAQSGRTTDYRQDDEAWWTDAVENGAHVGEVQYDPSAGIYSTDIAVRIDNEHGRTLGVLKAVLNIEEAIRVIEEARTEGVAEEQRTDAFRLLTADGRVLYSTRPFTRFEDAASFLPQGLLRGEGWGRSGTFDVADPETGDLLCAYARSTGHREFQGRGWILILEHRKEKIHAPLALLNAQIWTVSLLVALAGVLIGSILCRTFAGRIVRLQKGAEIIGSGRLDHRIGSKYRDEVGQLARAFDSMAENLQEITASRDELNDEIAERQRAEEILRDTMAESERLLLNVLPRPIADRLKCGPGVIADRFEDATILFADIVDFTQVAHRVSAIQLVGLLNDIFSVFDHLADRHGLEKIKTVGDTYMVAGGVPTPREDHAEAVAEMALDMQAAVRHFETIDGEPFTIRIGIHTGPVVAGIIGVRKFSYDLWGEAVNIASRMESYGLPGRIQVSEATYERLREEYDLEPRGTIQAKGIGELKAYFLNGKLRAEQGTAG